MRSARRTFVALLVALIVLLGYAAPIGGATTTYTTYLPITTSEPDVGFSIIQPHATTNIDTNPSFELATTGWTLSSGATIARDTTVAKRGVASLKITPSSTDNSGAYKSYSLTAQNYTWSVDILGASGVTYEIHYANSSGTTLATIATVTGTGDWDRIEGTFTEGSTATRRIYVKKRGSGTNIFWIDGVQLEALPYSTSYCDGDQPGCLWVGGKHVSTSQRSAMYRGGGKKISLASLGAHLISQQGTGMATIENQRVPYAIKPGSYFQRSNVRERSLTIALSIAGDGTANWHYRRQTLIDLVKPDLVTPEQPFRLTYDDGGREVYLDCYYEDGLNIADGIRDIEAIPIKCLATDPFWKFDGNNATALNMQSSFTSRYMAKRSPSGVWSIFSGTDASASVWGITVGADGNVYAYGQFSSMNGVSNTAYIAYYSPVDTSWHAIGTGILTVPDPLSDRVGDIAIAPNGDIYAKQNYGVQKYNGSSWSRLWTVDANNRINAIALGIDGTLYAVGNFTTINGVSATRVAKYNGSAWSAMGSGLASEVRDVTVGPNGTVYACTSGGGVYYWTGSAWTQIGSTFDNVVDGLKFGPDGSLYAVGQFTEHIKRWNGAKWSSLGTGLANSPSTVTGSSGGNTIAIHTDGSIYVGTIAGSSSSVPDGFYRWNGTNWQASDIDLPGTGIGTAVYAVAFGPDGSLYIGTSVTGTTVATGVTTVTNNGSSVSYPTIKVNGPTSGTTTLQRIANITTGAALYLNYTMVPGEVLTFTSEPGKTKASSNSRGDITHTLLPGSRLSQFTLLPGNNTIVAYAMSSTVTGTIEWQETGWSVDVSGT